MSDMVVNRKPARIAMAVILIALVSVVVYISYLFISGIQTASADSTGVVLDTGVVYEGVSALGVDLSGAPRGEVPKELEDAAQTVLGNVKIDFTVNGDQISLSAEDVGAVIDTAALMDQAYAVGRQGGFSDREAHIASAQQVGIDIPYALTYDPKKLEESVHRKTKALNQPAKDAVFSLEKTSDEEKLMCDATITIEPEVTGLDINYETLLGVLNDKMKKSDCFGGEAVTADVTVTQPAVTAEQLAAQYQKIGTYKTEYSTSAYGRRYNIWKMADIINGVTIQPGETWSINDEAGPRTYSRGWEGAPGIESGQYVEQAGGGICQVNSTLYNAVLRAELEVVDRTHHSWPLAYIPEGLDATISTGKPDFKFKNTTDSPIIIYAKCDGEAKTIEVSIYRSAMDYVLDFTSEVVSTSGTSAVREVADPALPAGTRKEIQHSHPKVVVDVYKHTYDLSGNEISKELYYTDTYNAQPAIVAVGPALPVPAA